MSRAVPAVCNVQRRVPEGMLALQVFVHPNLGSLLDTVAALLANGVEKVIQPKLIVLIHSSQLLLPLRVTGIEGNVLLHLRFALTIVNVVNRLAIDEITVWLNPLERTAVAQTGRELNTFTSYAISITILVGVARVLTLAVDDTKYREENAKRDMQF